MLYATKPGYIVAPIVAIAICIVLAIQEKSKRGIIQALFGLIVMAGTIAVMYAAAYGLGYQSTVLSVYEKQLSAVHMDAFLKAIVKYPYYFILACGVFAFILPFKLFYAMHRETKAFFIIVAFALAGVILGTAWVINGYEYATNTVHMRYVGPYVMMFLVFSHANTGESTRKIKCKGKNWSAIAVYSAIAFTVLSCIVLGCGVGTDSGTLAVANLSLAILNKAFLPAKNIAFGSAIVVGICTLAAFATKKWRLARIQKTCMAIMAVLFMLSNIAGYSLIRKDTVFSRAEESQELAKQIGDREYLYVCTSERVLNNASLDVNSKKSTNYVELNDLFNHTYEANGLYEPFVPWDMRGRISDRLTPETNVFVIEPTAFAMLKLSDKAQYNATASNDLFMVTFTDGERWVDSMIANVKLYKLEAGEVGLMVIYDDALMDQECTIRMEIGAKQDTRIKINSSTEIKYIDVKAGREWYEIVFEHAENAYNFVCDEMDLNVYQYEVVK